MSTGLERGPDGSPGGDPGGAPAGDTVRRQRRAAGLGVLQRLGRSLMLPIAALPVAALLLRLGQPDMLGAGSTGLALATHLPWLEPVAAVLMAAGGSLFANLALLFAVGVAVGFARRSDGSTALAAVVGYLVFEAVTGAMSPYVLPTDADGTSHIDYGVFGGIVIGICTAVLWERFHRVKLPTFLAFFGGRRFVPILTANVGLVLGVVLSFLYPAFDKALVELGEWLSRNSVVGAGFYGFANRLLIPFGLHHILNSVPWFAVGSYSTATGQVVHGDVARFLNGDPTAGAFMTGFFPITMFALPAAALAIYHEAAPGPRKRLVGGVLLSGALTSLVTGVTEPLEFAFMFVAWPLFLLHAVLTGTSLALVNALGIKDGFGFSAGAIDYALNFTAATEPLLLIPVGLGYAVVYYMLFRFAIRRFDLRTPGREEDEPPEGGSQPVTVHH